MALNPNEFIITNGPPAAGRQIMQSAGIGPTDVAIKGDPVTSQLLLIGGETNDQSPAGENTALQVTFGPAVGTGADKVQLLANGAIQFNTPGTYSLYAFFSYGRDGGGAPCEVVTRTLADGVQVGGSWGLSVDTDDQTSPFSLTYVFNVSAPPTLITFEIARNTAGPNDGGLVAVTPSVAGWNPGSSAGVRIWELDNG